MPVQRIRSMDGFHEPLRVDGLREGLKLGRIEPHPYLAVGALVRVKSGLMAGMCGIFLRRKNGCRIVLTLDLIMKSVAVEVDIR